MNWKRCNEWLESHTDVFLDLVRIYLGLGLLIKGVFLAAHPEQLALPPDTASLAPFVRAVPYVHVLGGLLLAVGVLTRLAALAQIPILFGAVFLVNLPQMAGLLSREAVEFSALVLFIMVLIAIKGAGRLSLTRYWKRAPSSHAVPHWLEEHPDLFLDLVRTYLGVGLFLKGIYLMQHREQLMKLLDESSGLSLLLIGAAHYVIPAHFAGGLLLVCGLITRVSALVQVPALLGAVFCVYLPRFQTLELRQNLEFSALVLFLLVLLGAWGAGRFSLDHLRRRAEPEHLQPQPAH